MGLLINKKARHWPNCGARTRSGAPCKAAPTMDKLYGKPRNGRCKNHGGMSLGRSQPEREAERISKRNAKRAKWYEKLLADRAQESADRAKAARVRRNRRRREKRARVNG